jgi:hypothetical protein
MHQSDTRGFVEISEITWIAPNVPLIGSSGARWAAFAQGERTRRIEYEQMTS